MSHLDPVAATVAAYVFVCVFLSLCGLLMVLVDFLERP